MPDPVFEEDAVLEGVKQQGRKVQKDEVETARESLFETGSAFKLTDRSDVVGIDNVLMEIDDIIHWLRNSAAYQRFNSRLEPGIIFEGDPGTGKTLVSRYIASASDALFVNVRDWPHEGSLFKDSDIANLFKMARDNYAKHERPIVLFWDEFENGAVERSNATPEQVQVVSQLTAELDGVHGKNEGILLIGCTNYIHGIDRALRREGRMGIQIEFTPPDREGKRLLLRHYLGVYKIDGDIDLETLSYFFDSGANAAAIEEACVEAWRYAVRRSLDNGAGPSLAQDDLIKVFLKRLVGPPTTFVNLPREDRARIAVHECGHAIMALAFGIPLRLITVRPGKKSLGRVIYAEVREHIGTLEEMVSQMRVAVGSIVAEEAAGLPAITGSNADIEKLNWQAAKLVDRFNYGERSGLFNISAVSGMRKGDYSGPSPSVSSAIVESADTDVTDILAGVYKDAQVVMERLGKDPLWELAELVTDKVTLTGDEFADLFREVIGYEPTSLRPGAKMLSVA